MIKRDLLMMDALDVVAKKRQILPNDGFLKQLVDLNDKLYNNSDCQS